MSVWKYTNIQQQVFINEDDMFLKLTSSLKKCWKMQCFIKKPGKIRSSGKNSKRQNLMTRKLRLQSKYCHQNIVIKILQTKYMEYLWQEPSQHRLCRWTIMGNFQQNTMCWAPFFVLSFLTCLVHVVISLGIKEEGESVVFSHLLGLERFSDTCHYLFVNCHWPPTNQSLPSKTLFHNFLFIFQLPTYLCPLLNVPAEGGKTLGCVCVWTCKSDS